jgi:hypothetical protein
MSQATSAEVQKNFGEFRVKAEREPVVVMHYNKPSVVLLSADEYARLKRRDKRAVATEDLPDWLVERIAATRMDKRHAKLNPKRKPRAAAGR